MRRGRAKAPAADDSAEPGSGEQPYAEDVFRLFLGHERRRAERAGRSLLLVLVEMPGPDGQSGVIDEDAASLVFQLLGNAVRDADFVGWYRAQRVAAAALTQARNGPLPDVSSRVGERVTQVLREHLPPPLAARMEVRVLQLRATPGERHA